MSSRRKATVAAGITVMTSLGGCLDRLLDRSTGTDSGTVVQQREIVTTYDDAVVARNDATTARDEGVTAFNEESYPAAIESIETALTEYRTANEGFAEAADLARELDEDDAAALCETAVTETALQVDATEAALSAARAADGDADAGTINGHIETFRTYRDEAAALTVEDADAVAVALGLEP
ncbi:hypothetical protein [Halorubrum salinum]|uniref:hypothetical protein n=1 Tax=Halorubrum salinum TaxID=767517 RepID=UPI002111ADE2|nr:hypothetical protein [Halorubrum salinum]